jgi:hypothetical protein
VDLTVFWREDGDNESCPRAAPSFSAARRSGEDGWLNNSLLALVNRSLSRAHRRRRRVDLKTPVFLQNLPLMTGRGRRRNRNPDQDTADLTNPMLPGLNRFSNPNLHSHAKT